MIILNQDRTSILNFNNVSNIYIDTNETNKKIYSTNTMGTIETMLGEYKSEERAKEVLQEIIEALAPRKPQNLTELANYRQTIKYEMPEE